MSRGTAGTTTESAILGMLAIRPFTPYELSKHFDRSLGRMWPRARSKLFEAPKRLADAGLARAAAGATGRRPRTEYSITAKGRRALSAWLAQPGAGPNVEFEALLKVFFAEHGTKAAVVANLEGARDWARAEIDEHLSVGRAYLSKTGPFQERAATVIVSGRFLAEFALMVERWATWALDTVASWPDDPAAATPDDASLAELTDRLQHSVDHR